ncbi:MAG: glycosyltransferase family 2 protein [Gallionella sp.]|nr:MAG: glycosyltransferase family 2 protein [Gallionella sp.]
MLLRCLESIRTQTLQPSRVIVIDNASSDGSEAAAAKAFPEFTIVALNENCGFAAANNYAVKIADDCEWLALLNPDAYAAQNWLERLLDAAQRNNGFSVFGTRMLMDNDPSLLDGVGDVYHISGLAWRKGHGMPAYGRFEEPVEIISPCAAAALYCRQGFLAVGGFDEDYFCYMEDVDLGLRFHLFGLRCLYVPGSLVRHTGAALTGNHSDFSIYHGHRNLVWTYIKNMPGALFWLLLPVHLALNIVAIVWFTLHGQGRVILSAKWDALCGIPKMWSKRHYIQKNRVVSIGEFWHFLNKSLLLGRRG